MSINLQIPVLNPADILDGYGAGALIRIERAATEAGAYAEILTEPLVATDFLYEVWDAGGVSTSWYRTRYSNSANTAQSEYGDPFSPGQPASYASVDDLLLAMRQNISDSRFLANAQVRLEETTRDLIREIGYSFFRTPEETHRYHGTGDHRLHVHEGIVSLTTVEMQLTPGGSFVALDPTDYYLEGQPDETYRRPGEPFFHIVLEQLGTYRTFPKVRRGVRLTGVFGWPAVLSDHRAANIAWARQKLAADPSLPGGPIGPEEMGSPVGVDRWPRAVYDLVNTEAERFWCSL